MLGAEKPLTFFSPFITTQNVQRIKKRSYSTCLRNLMDLTCRPCQRQKDTSADGINSGRKDIVVRNFQKIVERTIVYARKILHFLH